MYYQWELYSMIQDSRLARECLLEIDQRKTNSVHPLIGSGGRRRYLAVWATRHAIQASNLLSRLSPRLTSRLQVENHASLALGSSSLPVDSGKEPHIWKPIPVRIFYTFVIYQGYDMDILSGKSYDVTYRDHRYDMDIPNANDLEWHILVIYFLTFGQIF